MRSVFVGTGGFLGRIDSETRCAFWTEEPTDHGFDPPGSSPLTLRARRTRRLRATSPGTRSRWTTATPARTAFAKVLVEASELN